MAASITPADTAITLRGASIWRANQSLLRGVDLDVTVGGRLVIAGRNGAGKTTLLRLIAGLMRPNEGAGSVLGCPFPLSTAARRRILASLDEPAFWPWMTARGTLKTVADLSGQSHGRVDEALRSVGLDADHLAASQSKRVGRFSQGMRKRLQVASILALEGDLLLLDEPTASLDEEGTDLIWQALDQANKAGRTIVVATHDSDASKRFRAQRIRLEQGQIVEDEPGHV